ncbi:MAG: ISAs1 family transposase, partial [Ardenticatenaceae bacterium]
MDEQKYSTLWEALRDVPDPRAARGKRYEWSCLLVLLVSALVSGQRNGRAIGQWVQEHASELVAHLQPAKGRLPSTATLRRVLCRVDLTALEERVAQYSQALVEPHAAPTASPSPTADTAETPLRGHALDGKAVRGANKHGTALHLVSVTQHGSGIVLAQRAVDDKSNEIPAAAELLAGRALRGTVTTLDALLAQQELLQQIRDQQGHSLAVIKRNQPHTYAAIQLVFNEPPWRGAEYAEEYRWVQTINKGHGRLETRTLERTTALNDYLAWPDVGQVLRRTWRRVRLSTGEVEEEVSYAITSLHPQQADAAALEAFWRGHWTIENRTHYVRDVTFGEDACQIHTHNAPHALAVLRNALLNLLRHTGWHNIADALRHYGAYVSRALALVGVP